MSDNTRVLMVGVPAGARTRQYRPCIIVSGSMAEVDLIDLAKRGTGPFSEVNGSVMFTVRSRRVSRGMSGEEKKAFIRYTVQGHAGSVICKSDPNHAPSLGGFHKAVESLRVRGVVFEVPEAEVETGELTKAPQLRYIPVAKKAARRCPWFALILTGDGTWSGRVPFPIRESCSADPLHGLLSSAMNGRLPKNEEGIEVVLCDQTTVVRARISGGGEETLRVEVRPAGLTTLYDRPPNLYPRAEVKRVGCIVLTLPPGRNIATPDVTFE